jgi:hypothetical protein
VKRKSEGGLWTAAAKRKHTQLSGRPRSRCCALLLLFGVVFPSIVCTQVRHQSFPPHTHTLLGWSSLPPQLKPPVAEGGPWQ